MTKITIGERENIRRRDNYSCCLCGGQWFPPISVNVYPLERTIRVHHIDRNKDNNNRDNLISLCTPCHKIMHPVNDKYDTWLKLMVEYNETQLLALSDRRKYLLTIGKTRL